MAKRTLCDLSEHVTPVVELNKLWNTITYKPLINAPKTHVLPVLTFLLLMSIFNLIRYGMKLEDNAGKTGYIKCKPASTVIGKNYSYSLILVMDDLSFVPWWITQCNGHL